MSSNRRNAPRADQPRRVAEVLLSWVDLELVSIRTMQTLWAGYGHICAVEAKNSLGEKQQLILKLITPPRASGRDEGHLRKMLSYDVEQYFYDRIAPNLPSDVAVADCVAITRSPGDDTSTGLLEGVTATLLADLRPAFPVAGEKRGVLEANQVHAAIDWLAKFHATSWTYLPDKDGLSVYVLPPLEEDVEAAKEKKVWLNGGYTYLATRMSESASLERDKRSEWSRAFCSPKAAGRSAAQLAADFLTPRGRPYETLIHGDVKSENLFTTEDGSHVAFFDFQYVGLGFGVCDLAKLFTCSVPIHMLTSHDEYDIPDKLAMDDGEKELLQLYRSTLLGAAPHRRGPKEYSWDTLVRHWETALVDWCRFQASWGFWGNTEWLEARVRCILADDGWTKWIEKELQGPEKW